MREQSSASFISQVHHPLRMLLLAAAVAASNASCYGDAPGVATAVRYGDGVAVAEGPSVPGVSLAESSPAPSLPAKSATAQPTPTRSATASAPVQPAPTRSAIVQSVPARPTPAQPSPVPAGDATSKVQSVSVKSQPSEEPAMIADTDSDEDEDEDEDAETAPLGSTMQGWRSCVSPCRCGVACPPQGCTCNRVSWKSERLIPWQMLAHGEYIGPARAAHVPEYHLRVDDIVRCVYGLTGNASPQPYELNVGDVIRIESLGSPNLDRQAIIQPDGAVTLPLLGQVTVAGRNLSEVRDDIERSYKRLVKEPQISITPIKINTRVEELRSSVDERYGRGGQGVMVRITPAGTIQLPAIGSVPAQGLTLHELKSEVEARYDRRFYGVEITPILEERAPRYVYVVGEVKNSGRFTLEAPTTVIQAIAMAGGYNVGAKLRKIVVFRRDDNWCLMATQLDLERALIGKSPCPPDEIWLRDSDVVLVPKGDMLLTDDWIQLFFTRGLYGVVPFNAQASLTKIVQ